MEGHVLAGGIPASAEVRAISMSGQSFGRAVASCTSDSVGGYRLELPVGGYSLTLRESQRRGQEVPVHSGIQRVDIRRGRLTLKLLTAAALDGQSLDVRMEGAELGQEYTRPQNATGEVRDGILEVTFALVDFDWCRLGVGPNRCTWWLPGTLDREAADVVAVPLDAPLILERSLERHAVLSGRVTYDVAPAFRRWEIDAIGADSTIVGCTTTEDDGSFILDLFDAQPVKLRIGANPSHWVGGGNYEGATVFAPAPGERIENILADLEAGSISVRLEGPGLFTGHSATLTLSDADGRDIGVYWIQSSRILEEIPAGRYRLHIRRDGDPRTSNEQPWVQQWWDGAATPEEATWIEVVDGATTPIVVRLIEGGAIEGRVIGRPRGIVSEIRLYDSGGERWSSRALSDNGDFSLRGLEDGVYYLALFLPAGSPPRLLGAGEALDERLWWYPGTAVFDSAQAVVVVHHQRVTGIDWFWPED